VRASSRQVPKPSLSCCWRGGGSGASPRSRTPSSLHGLFVWGGEHPGRLHSRTNRRGSSAGRATRSCGRRDRPPRGPARREGSLHASGRSWPRARPGPWRGELRGWASCRGGARVRSCLARIPEAGRPSRPRGARPARVAVIGRAGLRIKTAGERRRVPLRQASPSSPPGRATEPLRAGRLLGGGAGRFGSSLQIEAVHLERGDGLPGGRIRSNVTSCAVPA
jgi:hypothetical protein